MVLSRCSAGLKRPGERVRISIFGRPLGAFEVFLYSDSQFGTVYREIEIDSDRVVFGPIANEVLRRGDPNRTVSEGSSRARLRGCLEHIAKAGIAGEVDAFLERCPGCEVFEFAPVHPQSNSVFPKAQLHLL